MRQLVFVCVLAITGMAALPNAARADQNVVVVIDDSGSMEERMQSSKGRIERIEAAKQALIGVLSQLPPRTKVGVLALNSQRNGSSWIIPFGTGSPSEWESSIRELRARGGTPLGEFLKLGADELLTVRSKEIYGTYRLLIVTDGEANNARLVDSYLPEILSRGIVVDVIGVDMKSKHSLATRVHNYRSADDDRALQEAISEVFAETSSDDQAAEDDFEILAALPDEFATEALKALSAGGNEPIAGDAYMGDSIDFSIGSNSAGGVASLAAGSMICCFGGIVLVIIVAGIVLKKR